MGSVTETDRQRDLVMADFVAGSTSGDFDRLTSALSAMTWSGAWRTALAELLQVGAVHPSAQAAFKRYWREFRPASDPRAGIDGDSIWRLTRDLDGDLELLSAGLRLLLPTEPRERSPIALYRGGAPSERLEGRHGAWWTPDPTLAEFYARLSRNSAGGHGEVVATIGVQDAIICKFNHFEFLIDPRKIEDVFSVATVPAYSKHDCDSFDFVSQPAMLDGIPSGYDFQELDQWLAMGRPESGVPACRFRREVAMFQPVMVA